MAGYDPKDAEGFIRILGLPARVQASLKKSITDSVAEITKS
jgi:hypothetical protein